MKLYIKVFGAPFKGEASRRDRRTDGKGAGGEGATPNGSLADSLLAMVGLPASPRTLKVRSAEAARARAPVSGSGDTKLQQLLHHISRSRPDWAQVTHDWDSVGRAEPMLVRLSPRASAVLGASRGMAADPGWLHSSAAGARVAAVTAAVARAGGSRMAVSNALEVEEASLLKAEEKILLQRRASDARAIARARGR